MNYVIEGALLLLVLGLGLLCLKYWKLAGILQKRYAGISDIQSEVDAAKSRLEQARKAFQEFEKQSQEQKNTLLQDIKIPIARSRCPIGRPPLLLPRASDNVLP